MIIDTSYFIGEIYLPQVGGSASEFVNNNNSIQWYIDKYECEILYKGLGKQLADEFLSNIEPTGGLIPSADAKWDRLLNGFSYVKNDITYYWKGLINVKGSYKSSLMAYYIYYKYIESGLFQNSTLGIVKAVSENSNSVSANTVLTKSWNDMLDWYGGECYNNSVAPQYIKGIAFYDYFNGKDNTKEVSLFTFLTDHSIDYENWFFTPLERINRFDI